MIKTTLTFSELYSIFEEDYVKFVYAKIHNLRMAAFEPPDAVIEADGDSARCWRPP